MKPVDITTKQGWKHSKKDMPLVVPGYEFSAKAVFWAGVLVSLMVFVAACNQVVMQ